MKLKYIALFPFLSLPLIAQEASQTAKVTQEEPVEKDAELAKAKKEQEKLSTANALQQEKTKAKFAELRSEVQRLKLEKEAITERLALAEVKKKETLMADVAELEARRDRLTLEAAVAKAKADKLIHTLKFKNAKAGQSLEEMEQQMKEIKVEKARKAFANAQPVYLDNPLKNGDTLVISDRRISLNGPITRTTADYITERLSFFNNLDGDKPIFIVIDSSPGGSVMAGYRILKAMEASDSPVHVVVKSFAASMAASITTLAEHSYCYPNAVMLHHQISSTFFMTRLNLTEQKEMAEESQEWWERLAKPMADKMGITMDEFIKQMYENASSGDWAEFGDEAQKLKWVNTIVTKIDETSLLENPDSIKKPTKKQASHGMVEGVDEEGNPVMYLPRTNPRDRYFIYNPDGYYRLK